jgi:hypothetical protein
LAEDSRLEIEDLWVSLDGREVLNQGFLRVKIEGLPPSLKTENFLISRPSPPGGG